jgi:CelD/BcsL family acetyltransferase involved in cellulose biosynthesis
MSTFDLELISSDEYKMWFEQNYDIMSRRFPFHHPAWLRAVKKGMHVDVVFISIVEAGMLIGVLPAFTRRLGHLRFFGSPLRGTHTSYLGPAMLRPCHHAHEVLHIIQACSAFARRRLGTQYTEFTVCDDPAQLPKELATGWNYSNAGTYCIDLSRGKDSIWAAMTQGARRRIRKSEGLGLRIVQLADAQTYYRMLNDTFARRGIVPSHPERFFQAIFDELVPLGLVWAWGTEYEGRIVSGGLFLHDEREVHYVSGASFSEYRFLPTSYLLHWHTIVSAVDRGLLKYDLTGRGVASINQFKEAFRAVLRDYTSLYWAPQYIRSARKAFFSLLPYLRRWQRLARDLSLRPQSRSGGAR